MAGGGVETLLEHLSAGRIFSAVLLFLIASFALDIARKPRYPDSLPRVGHGKGFIAASRNYLSYFTKYNSWVQEGYDKYSKYGRTFVAPSAMSRPADIIVPRSQTAWLLEQPDRVIGAKEAHDDILYGHYNFLGKRFFQDTFHIRVIHKWLSRAIPGLIPYTQEEVHNAVDRVFGLDTEQWKSLNLWEAWLDMVPQVTTHVMVGGPVNRNPELLKSMVKFTNIVIQNGFIMSTFPKILHPIMGRLLAISNWIQYSKGAKHTIPVIKKRLEDMSKKAAGDPAYENWVEPEDFITWSIRLALAEGNDTELRPDVISKRMLPIEFAAIHTTALTGHSTMLDLLASNPSLGYLDELREEAGRVFKEGRGKWSKDGLSRLYRIDSAIRESQRLNNIGTTLVERMVVAPEGVTNEAEGWHAPRGSYITLNLQGLHHDPDIYAEPYKYDAFRHSRAREEYEARPPEAKDPAELLQMKKLGMVCTSDSHLAFGHGRHACPGRFFVAGELKMFMAYILLNYEIKHIPERPQAQWIGMAIIPPLQARIEVRRRKGTA